MVKWVYICRINNKQQKVMAVRKQHSRFSQRHIFQKIGDVSYLIEADEYKPKSLTYTAKKSLINGKINIPSEFLKYTTIVIICMGNGEYKFEGIN